MTDIVDRATRSRMMSRIGGRDTKPELVVRRSLHQRGLRFSLHRKDIAGRPDLVLSKHDTVIFVHGCFWHWHSCDYFRLPKSNETFWKSKLGGNRERDERNQSSLLNEGWYVAVVWECAIRDRTSEEIAKSMDQLAAWIRRERYRRHLLVLPKTSR